MPCLVTLRPALSVGLQDFSLRTNGLLALTHALTDFDSEHIFMDAIYFYTRLRPLQVLHPWRVVKDCAPFDVYTELDVH